MRRTVIVGAAAAVLGALAGPGRAQVCHDPAELGAAATDDVPHAHHAHHHHAAPPPALRVDAGIAAEARSLTGGTALATTTRLGLAGARWRVRVAMPLHQLDRDDRAGVTRGPGDLQLGGSVVVVARTAWGVEAGTTITLPTGDADADLGMGHVMVMPVAGGWGRLGALTVAAQLGGGRAIGAMDHAHDGPAVAPMNATELTASIRASYALTARWKPAVTAAIAEPVVDPGIRRAVVGVAVEHRRGRWRVALDLQRAVAGDPFHHRLVIDAGVAF